MFVGAVVIVVVVHTLVSVVILLASGTFEVPVVTFVIGVAGTAAPYVTPRIACRGVTDLAIPVAEKSFFLNKITL